MEIGNFTIIDIIEYREKSKRTKNRLIKEKGIQQLKQLSTKYFIKINQIHHLLLLLLLLFFISNLFNFIAYLIVKRKHF